MTKYQILSYGGGTNSTAILVGMLERGERPDAITFADTGGEKPHTYQHIDEVNQWCKAVGFPEITIVRGPMPQQRIDGTLENECIRLGTMPSKVYGFGNCSDKWKIEPQKRFTAQFAADMGCDLKDITRLIGFDADEPERATRALKFAHKSPCPQRFPLIEWEWGRDECVAAIARAGLRQPGKSACWFCPSSKKSEILWLRDNHPDLMARAIYMEKRALNGEGSAPAPTTVKGLGRHFAWADVIKQSDEQLCLFSDAGTPDVDCGCYDGE